MQNAKSVVMRIEFRIDATRAGAERIPLGYVVESWWEDMRWMGMIYRPSLTSNERKHVNFDTWPELANPKEFLERLFDDAWSAREGEAGWALERKFGPMSALQAFVLEAESDFAHGLSDPSAEETGKALLHRLHQRFEPHLKPACQAKILSFLSHSHAAKLREYKAPMRHSQHEPFAAVG